MSKHPKPPPQAQLPAPVPQQEPIQLPVPVPQATGQLVNPLARKVDYWCTWDPHTADGWAKVQVCRDDPTDRVEDHGHNQPFPCSHIFGHMVQLEDPESGELMPVQRTVFLSSDGRTLATLSEGVLTSLAWVIEFAGEPPWQDLPLCVIQKKSKRGRTYYKLEIAAKELLKP